MTELDVNINWAVLERTGVSCEIGLDELIEKGRHQPITDKIDIELVSSNWHCTILFSLEECLKNV